MTAREARVWLGICADAAVAGGLLAAADPASPTPVVPVFAGLVLAVAVGAGLVVVLGRAIPPRARVERARLVPVIAKGAALAVGALSEETFWRWYAIGTLSGRLGLAGAYAVSTVGFAASHVRGRAILVHLLTGAAFGGVFLATGSLTAAFLAHATYNLMILLALESRRPTPPGSPRFGPGL